MSLATELISLTLLVSSCSGLTEPSDNDTSHQLLPALASGREQFLLAWVSGFPYPQQPPPEIGLTTLSAIGAPQEEVTHLRTGDRTIAGEVDVAFNERYLVVWQAFRSTTGWDIEAALISVGEVISVERQWTLDGSTNNQSRPRVIPHDDGFAVGWSGYRDGFYRPFITTLDPDGHRVHSGPLHRPAKGFDGYNPGWGFTPEARGEAPDLSGYQLELQSVDGQLWIAWQDQSQWSPGKNGAINWFFARLTATDGGWEIEQLLRPTSPLLARTNGLLLCYNRQRCLFGGASVVGRGQAMAPAMAFNPQTLTHISVSNAKPRSHSGWDSETLFPLMDEAYSLYGPVDLIATPSSLQPDLYVAGVARTATRGESGYHLLVGKLREQGPAVVSRVLLESPEPMRNPSLAFLGTTHLVAIESALPTGGVRIRLCSWQVR
ncbi:hypothetical protein [Aestuariirhabdus litorea]|uniref:Uncharacterized protein n=1 Tax=Aestuariirhabdus litorea TaxID=2528527 RepID=A0A3P3VQJ8_9GAMM|nr:hypothetical protein [Aestuariirhabdus litorea]RRJ84607.1 hypothetical protein D0544_05745 [Aestuariirhabdus litorea]RWW97833.1 hypothetical protein DZC74_05740 [Endozoicomonadaceae bacterium GTF-13]